MLSMNRLFNLRLKKFIKFLEVCLLCCAYGIDAIILYLLTKRNALLFISIDLRDRRRFDSRGSLSGKKQPTFSNIVEDASHH